MQTYKRIIIYIVCIMLIVSVFVLPVSAASMAAAPSSIVPLMDDKESYTMNINGNGNYSVGTHDHVIGANWLTFTWNLDSAVYIKDFYFAVEVFAGVKSFEVCFNYTDHLTFTPVLISTKDHVRYYKVSVNDFIQIIELTPSFNSAYTGHFSLKNCFGVVDNALSLSNVTLNNQQLLYFAGSDELRRSPFETLQNASLPVTSYSKTDYVTEPVNPILAGYYFLRNDSGDFPVSYADSVSYLIETCGSADYASDGANFSAALLDNNGQYVAVLPVEIEPVATFLGHNHYFGSSDLQWPTYLYSVTVDTSGYDLKQYTLALDYQVDPVFVEEYDGFTGYTTTVHGIYVMPTIEDTPWYARFGKWLSDGFNSVVSAIERALNPNSSELSQAGQDMQNSASNIESASDSLGAVSQPEVNPDSLIGDYTNFDTRGLTILSSITSNSQVTAMMVVVFTFCLAGYIFFGKKG